MNEHITKFRKVEKKIVDGIAKRAKAFQNRGEKIHLIGVRRWGDDDGSFGFLVAVDPTLNGAEQDYEARDGTDGHLWRLKDDGPKEMQKIADALAEEHEDIDPDDFPGRSMTKPHGIHTYMLDAIALGLAAQLEVRVELLDTEAVPIEEDERKELRAWLKKKKLI